MIPREVRAELGLTPGEVEILVQGTRVVIEQAGSRLREIDGHLYLPASGHPISQDEIRELRLADQR